MRIGKVFAFIVAVAFGFAMATTLFASLLPGTPLANWATSYASNARINASDYSYQPAPGITSLIGDFVWGLAKTIQLIGGTPQLVADLLAVIGVPKLWADLISYAVSLSLVAFIIYMVSGRILSVS
jgi:hypothetical protein